MAGRVVFTHRDKQIFLDLISPRIEKLESKASGVRTIVEKQTAWREIMEGFNATSATPVDNIRQLKNLWKNLKTKAKKDNSADKKNRKKTGGGTATAMGTISQTICDLLPNQINAAIEDPVDDDADAEDEDDGVTASIQREDGDPHEAAEVDLDIRRVR